MDLGGKESKMTSRKRDRESHSDMDFSGDEELSSKDIKKDLNINSQIRINDKTFYDDKINSELQEILKSNQHWEKINKEIIQDIINSSKEFIFGNYDKYYYNRYLEALKDPRLNLIKREWFENKKCLHIGCNDGLITIMLAVIYQPKTISGIDIDYKLVKKAIKNVKYVERNNLSKKFIIENSSCNHDLNISNHINDKKSQCQENDNFDNNQMRDSSSLKAKDIISKMENMPKSFLLSLGFPKAKNLDRLEKLSNLKNEQNNLFPKNIFFTQENYVSKIISENEFNIFDTITSLSTSKWIHLNYGDVGIKIFFYNIYKSLKPGGIFLFEFQNWKSYKKRKSLSENIKDNFAEIKLRPESFKEYLENNYGYLLIDTLNPPANNKKMFERPIYVFRKRFDSEYN
jgi:7SK snRNA methylphosphate capping enzyme